MKSRFLIVVLVVFCSWSCKEKHPDKTENAHNTHEEEATSGMESTELQTVAELGPNFSPDGSKIVFYGYIDPEMTSSRIFSVNTNGTELKELSAKDTIGFHTEPIWSLDGKKIGYTSFLDEGARMMGMNADGSQLQVLARVTEKGFHMFSSWDLKGEGYYFFHWPAGEDFKPDAYHAIGDIITRLTTDGITNRPQMTADGTLYLSKIVDLKKNIYSKHILDRNSGKVTKVEGFEGWYVCDSHSVKQREQEDGTTFVLEDLQGNDLKDLGTVPFKGLMFEKIDKDLKYVAYNTSFDDGARIQLLEIATGRVIELTKDLK